MDTHDWIGTMKPEALNTIITARVLFDAALRACMVEDKHVASAGLVILQDAVELILYACLIEKGVDEQRSFEKVSFDELIGEIKKLGLKVIKSGTLKAMNKQRVIVKHYGQLAEPTTVRHYFSMSQSVVDDILKEVFGRTLNELFLYDILKNDEIKEHLRNSEEAIASQKYFDALVEVRKAVFLDIEQDYSIVGWKDIPHDAMSQGLMSFSYGGWKAPYLFKNKEWIDENVRDPFDYIQIDHERMRLDLLEWGVSTQDFWNLTKLTPSVFRETNGSIWLVKDDLQHIINAATEENARYCLDRAYSLILRKQEHSALNRQLEYSGLDKISIRLKSDQPLFEKASTTSKIVGELKKNKIYNVQAFVPGLSEPDRFAHILHIEREKPNKVYIGYLMYDETMCELIVLEP